MTRSRVAARAPIGVLASKSRTRSRWGARSWRCGALVNEPKDAPVAATSRRRLGSVSTPTWWPAATSLRARPSCGGTLPPPSHMTNRYRLGPISISPISVSGGRRVQGQSQQELVDRGVGGQRLAGTGRPEPGPRVEPPGDGVGLGHPGDQLPSLVVARPADGLADQRPGDPAATLARVDPHPRQL